MHSQAESEFAAACRSWIDGDIRVNPDLKIFGLCNSCSCKNISIAHML